MDTVLLTGSAGFIGMHTAERLLKLGYKVVSLDSINDYYDVSLKYARLKKLGIPKEDILYNQEINGIEGFSFIQLSLEDAGNLNNLFARTKIDYVIHLAAQAGVRYSITNPRNYIDSNVIGFYNILEACRYYPVKHLVFASSSSVYGLNKKVPFNESDHTAHPVSLYAATKKANEVIGHSYSQLYQIPMTGLRFFTVYGPWGRPDMAPFKFTKAILNDETIQVYNHGEMQRDFTYVDDIVEGVCLTLEHIPTHNKGYSHVDPDPSSSSAPYRIFNIGNSKPVHLMDFIKSIEKATGKKAIMDLMPMQPGDVHITYANTTNLQRVTGYNPSTSIQDGINAFVEWYTQFYSKE
ncbi:NAD-dependent epimerase [Chondrinema litorale]|uniref:NAD-dependent epimerase n=1 Tax=Chondrinema litorale TaxID=2994555 RepID=UPI002543683D|nr:NAD-dependent epimerase [Chondrinema litorale]UZS00163.1 NAD-dependent epimerase [Chondrinema litorale]